VPSAKDAVPRCQGNRSRSLGNVARACGCASPTCRSQALSGALMVFRSGRGFSNGLAGMLGPPAGEVARRPLDCGPADRTPCGRLRLRTGLIERILGPIASGRSRAVPVSYRHVTTAFSASMLGNIAEFGGRPPSRPFPPPTAHLSWPDYSSQICAWSGALKGCNIESPD